jgi:ATP-dependent exoDNAse (exonuclease V) alpha subunit
LDINKKYVLLAPTGRAASDYSYSNKPAFTIHKKIYFQKKLRWRFFTLQQNKHKNTIFIVDEASM